MLFVREALEQATHEQVAAFHASRFPVGALVADLTAGIGADLIALAARGPAMGFELDPERAECARWNVHGLGEVRTEDSLAVDWDFEYAFADPARRVEGRRTLDPEDFSPNPVRLAERMRGLRLGGMKLSPLLPDGFLESLAPRLEFVSFGRECREALVWTGSEARGGRFAVHVESGEALEGGEPAAAVEDPRPYLLEADPAAIRAHGLGTLCSRHGLTALGDSNGYLTGEAPAESPWLRPYRVLYSGKADVKATRRELRRLEADVPEIKQRGAGVDPPILQRALGSHGRRAVSLAVWTVGRSLRHTLLEGLD